MEEREDFGLEDFEGALFDDEYHDDTDTTAEADLEAESTTDAQETDDTEVTEEEGEPEEEAEEEAEEPEEEAVEESDSATDAEQMFTIKVNKESRQVNLEEMTTLAQKGADYDRVKEQAAQLRQANTDLQAKLDGMTPHQEVLDILSIVADKGGVSLEQLAESLYINFRKSAGASEDVAREELKSARLEKELNAYKAKQTQQQAQETDNEARVQKELEDFQAEYPDVNLTEELVDKLLPDIKNGMRLAAAYRKYEKIQDAAKIAELERKLSAKAQNDKNKRRSPGSQQDSGGRRAKSDYEEFESALFA